MMGLRLSATGLLLIFLGFCGIPMAFAEDGVAKHFFPAAPQQKAPSVVLRDERGGEILLSDLLKSAPPQGALLVSFWARWCAPCAKELPDLNRFALSQEKVAVILVAEEASDAATLKAYLTRRGVTLLPLYGDPSGDAARLLGLRGLPGSVLIRADGRMIGSFMGATSWDSAEMNSFLASFF